MRERRRGPGRVAGAFAIVVPLVVFGAACGLSVVGVGADSADGAAPTLIDGATATDGSSSGNVTSDGSVVPPGDAGCPGCQTSNDSAAACGQFEVQCGAGCCRGFCAEGTCKTPVFWVRGDDAVDGASFTWPDRSGAANDAVQATASLKPTILGTLVNGHKILHFANNARLVVANVNAFKPGTGDVVWFHVSRNAGSNAVDKNQVFGTLIDADPWSGITSGFDSKNHPYGMFRSNTDVFIKSATTTSLDEVVVMDMRRTGGNAELRRNGTSIATGAATMNVNGGALVVGAERATGSEFLNGDIAEIVLFATAFTDPERAAIAKQLGALYGVSVP